MAKCPARPSAKHSQIKCFLSKNRNKNNITGEAKHSQIKNFLIINRNKNINMGEANTLFIRGPISNIQMKNSKPQGTKQKLNWNENLEPSLQVNHGHFLSLLYIHSIHKKCPYFAMGLDNCCLILDYMLLKAKISKKWLNLLYYIY